MWDHSVISQWILAANQSMKEWTICRKTIVINAHAGLCVLLIHGQNYLKLTSSSETIRRWCLRPSSTSYWVGTGHFWYQVSSNTFMFSMPCLENKMLLSMGNTLAAYFFLHTYLPSPLTYELRDKSSLRLLTTIKILFHNYANPATLFRHKLNFCTHGGMQWCAAVALDLSKCEEYGIWVSGTHSTTRM